MLKSVVRQAARTWFSRNVYDLGLLPEPWERESLKSRWEAEAAARARYDALDPQHKRELPALLSRKYERTAVLGKVRVYDAVAALATVIDPLDPSLGCLSQLTHQLQVASWVEQDGGDETLLLCALVHDLGKILLATDEDPINVEASGQKRPLDGTPGAGLRNCTFRWDHGDFAYLRLKDYVPADVAWLLRHHSIDVAACEPYMDDGDRANLPLLHAFVPYDLRKDVYALPAKRLEDYRELLDRRFPDPILI